MAHGPWLQPLGYGDPREGRTRTLEPRPINLASRPERRLDCGLWARIERDEMRFAARGLRVGVGRCRCRTALARRAYRRTLAAHSGTELGATVEQPPDPRHRPRRV